MRLPETIRCLSSSQPRFTLAEPPRYHWHILRRAHAQASITIITNCHAHAAPTTTWIPCTPAVTQLRRIRNHERH